MKVVIFPHNLRIVDYVIGVPGSLHDSNAFRRTKVARSPNDFFGAGEWLWADSAYATQMWCITPFKRPPGGGLTSEQRKFNYHLSTVSMMIIIHHRVQSRIYHNDISRSACALNTSLVP